VVDVAGFGVPRIPPWTEEGEVLLLAFATAVWNWAKVWPLYLGFHNDKILCS
jgi:hypothetical protein